MRKNADIPSIPHNNIDATQYDSVKCSDNCIPNGINVPPIPLAIPVDVYLAEADVAYNLQIQTGTLCDYNHDDM